MSLIRKGEHYTTPQRRKKIEDWLDQGKTIKWIAVQEGVTANAIHVFIRRDRRKENKKMPNPNRRAGYLGYSYEFVPENLRWEVWERDNFTCKQCGIRRSLAVDHIKPLLLGGKTEMENLQTLCRSCNSKKGTS